MKKKYIALIILSSLCAAYYFNSKKVDPATDFYNTTFLRNSPAVEKILRQEGFFDVEIMTEDKLKLSATILDKSQQEHVQATLISCPGFVPGAKEGMTTLYAMLKENPYNFLFLDMRGHGKSEGELLTYKGIKHYGEFDYLDIVATVKFMVQYNIEHNIEQNIIVHGLCSGAFHTIKAMSYLRQHDTLAYDSVKGIIFDSGWPSVPSIAETTLTSESCKRCSDYNISCCAPYLSWSIVGIYNYFFKEYHCSQEPITKAMSEIDQPILFIHGENDTYIPIHHVHSLVSQAKKPTSWFIKESTHAAHHLKHQEAYKIQMEQFIKSVL